MKIYAGDKLYELGEHGLLRFYQKTIFHITPKEDGLEIYTGGRSFAEQLPRDVMDDAHEVCSKCGI